MKFTEKQIEELKQIKYVKNVTSNYQNLLKKFGVIQSMSRKGNCLDNAPTESFFGHLKDEVDFKNISFFQEIKNVIDNYIYFYNNHRF